jgi:hypothetical protein
LGIAILMGRFLRACRAPAFAAALGWPGAACALGDGVRLECGQQASAGTHQVMILLGVAATVAALTLLAWVAHRLWQRATGRYAHFSFALAVVIVTGALLVASGIVLSPVSSSVYANFGVELSAPARAIMDYPFLLSLPLILFPFLLLKLEDHPHREQYFAAFAALELALLCAAQWVLNSPILISC